MQEAPSAIGGGLQPPEGNRKVKCAPVEGLHIERRAVPMPREDDVRLVDGDHVVQFYGCEDEWIAVVGAYLVASLIDNDAVIVIAGAAHRAAFRAAALDAGVHLDAVRALGRLVELDADEILSRFMVDGSPDAARFDAVVGDLVFRSASTGRQVRAYGEMVAALWEAGNVAGAIEVEKLWNGLGAQLPFSLFCAYSAGMVSGTDVAEAFDEVCGAHSEVIAGAPTPADAEATRRFAGTSRAPGLARRFVTETVRAWDRDDLVDDCMIVASELVTNAVAHARSDVTLALSRRKGGVLVSVGEVTGAPPARVETSDEEGVQGVAVVRAIASAWGEHAVDGGKVSWVEVGVSKRAGRKPFEVSRRSLLLVLLEQGPRHGWGLAEDLRDAMGERIDRASVYRALHALEGDGLVSSTWKKSNRGAADQRAYRLTELGRASASAVRVRLESTIVRLESLLAR